MRRYHLDYKVFGWVHKHRRESYGHSYLVLQLEHPDTGTA